MKLNVEDVGNRLPVDREKLFAGLDAGPARRAGYVSNEHFLFLLFLLVLELQHVAAVVEAAGFAYRVLPL
jgi:hypothetical protein